MRQRLFHVENGRTQLRGTWLDPVIRLLMAITGALFLSLCGDNGPGPERRGPAGEAPAGGSSQAGSPETASAPFYNGSKEEQTGLSWRRPGQRTRVAGPEGARKGLGGGAHPSEGRAVPGPWSGRGESRTSDGTHQRPSWGGEVAGARGSGLEGSRRCSRMAWAVQLATADALSSRGWGPFRDQSGRSGGRASASSCPQPPAPASEGRARKCSPSSRPCARRVWPLSSDRGP